MGNADVRPHWIPDDRVNNCTKCKTEFSSLTERKHHCRNCGNIFCDGCTTYRYLVRYYPDGQIRRLCESCHNLIQNGEV